jgi:transcriptional regulator with XRE-family HTH domain
MDLGKAIKEIRKSKGFSQERLAKAAGVTQAALSQIENGKRPGSSTLQKISSALEIPESLIYAMGIEKGDVPEKNQLLYDELFPVVESMIKRIAGMK